MNLEFNPVSTFQYMIKKLESTNEELPYKFVAFSNFEPTSDEVMIWQKRQGFDPYKFGFYNLRVSKYDELFLVKWECHNH